jgi:hypothetical protein
MVTHKVEVKAMIKFTAWRLQLGLRRWLRLDEALGKDDLLGNLEGERANWRTVLASLDESQMIIPGAHGGWSVKDLLVHIAIWDRRGTSWIKTAAAGKMPEMPGPGLSWQDLDRLNQKTYLENRDKPLAEVMEEFNASHRELVEQVEALSDQAARSPVVGELIAWRYKHARGHRESIREWLDDVTANSGN